MVDQQRKMILVVDDEPLVCSSLEKSLNKAGYRTTTVESAERAVQELSASMYDVVITDLRLPHMDGFAVVDAARRHSPRIPVMMISAFVDEDSRNRAKEKKVDCFIQKPFDLSEITLLVGEVLHQASGAKAR